MKIITLNVNGVRASHKKGFFQWMLKEKADVVCIQEIKANRDQLVDEILHPRGYYGFFNSAEKKGYSGVAMYLRERPHKVTHQLGWEQADKEGRYLQADYKNISVVSLYMPSGTSGDERQGIKYDFMGRFEDVLRKMRRRRRECIICGDWNIAHRKIDLKNWRGNQKNSGFLPEERAWMDKVFDKIGMVDAFRVINDQADHYTWWSNRGQAWAKNVGWRIDYQIITPGLADKIRSATIYKKERFSDHAPLIMEYDVSI